MLIGVHNANKDKDDVIIFDPEEIKYLFAVGDPDNSGSEIHFKDDEYLVSGDSPKEIWMAIVDEFNSEFEILEALGLINLDK